MNLSKESLELINVELEKYPINKRRSAVMSALRIAQNEHGWLSVETLKTVADLLGIPETQVMEVATFYSMYNLKPVGKYKISICTNISCALRGAYNTVEFIEKTLKIKNNETTEDRQFTLQHTECMGACGDAPVVLINNHKMISFVTPEKAEELILRMKHE